MLAIVSAVVGVLLAVSILLAQWQENRTLRRRVRAAEFVAADVERQRGKLQASLTACEQRCGDQRAVLQAIRLECARVDRTALVALQQAEMTGKPEPTSEDAA